MELKTSLDVSYQTFDQAIWSSKRSSQCLGKGGLTHKGNKLNDQEAFDRVVIPVGQILLHHTEKAVQYTLNGDYEAVQDATRTTFTNTLSWLDLTTFQVCGNFSMDLRENILDGRWNFWESSLWSSLGTPCLCWLPGGFTGQESETSSWQSQVKNNPEQQNKEWENVKISLESFP